MSAPKIEDTTPSRWIEVFWWIVFAVPVIFVWFSTGNLWICGGIIAIRIAIMFVPYLRKKTQEKKPDAPKPVALIPQPINTPTSTTSIKDILKPFTDEAVSEWKGLLKMLHIYDHDKENKNLETYRKFRGWE